MIDISGRAQMLKLKQATFNVEPLEKLNIDHMNYFQFSVINQKTGSIFFLDQNDVR
jgi:hypothetical protein